MKDSNLIEVRTDTDHWYPAPTPYKGEDWPSVTTVLGVGYPKGVGWNAQPKKVIITCTALDSEL